MSYEMLILLLVCKVFVSVFNGILELTFNRNIGLIVPEF